MATPNDLTPFFCMICTKVKLIWIAVRTEGRRGISFYLYIYIYIFHTIPYTFRKLLTRRICVTIESFSSFLSFPLNSHDLNV